MVQFYKTHKKEMILFLLYLLLVPIFEILNRPIGTIHDLTTVIDDKIPFLIGFLPIYHSWFPFLIYFIIRTMIKDPKAYRPMIKTIILGLVFAYITFIVFQTTVPRPTVSGNNFLELWLQKTHVIDNHFAGFPSCHVLTTTALILGVDTSVQSSKIKFFVTVYGLIIIATTVLVKQHVFLDIPGGILYAIIPFLFFYIGEKKVDEKKRQE